tara:strand:- start:933 stop:2393 length:1461 start_codon:yes stop_codon:yes gene_type:complete
MGFNFGAFLGGAASQIVEDIDEQEKEVKLRTRTILDRQVAEAAENRKKFQDDKEKIEKQITSIAQLFGEDDPFRFNKARSIVAGGDEHYNTMYKELSTHKRLGGDMGQAYDYTAASEEQGFEGVADAAKGLAKLRTIEAPEFTESVRSEGARLFGIDAKSMYEKAKAQYEQAGLLPSSKEEFKDSVKKYGTGTINFQNLKKDKESIDKMYANNMQSILELDKNDPKYKEKRAKLEAEQEELTKAVAKMNSVSATVQATKLREEGDKDEGKTTSQHANLYSKALSEFRQGLGYDKTNQVIVDDNGEELYGKDAKDFFDNKINQWKQNYVKGMVDGNGNLIDDTSDTKSFLGAFGLSQYVGKPTEEEEEKVDKPKKITFEDKVKSAQDAGSPEAFLQGELGKISKGLSSERKNKIYQKIFEIVQEAYPNATNIQEIVNKEIDKYEAAQKAKTFVRNKGDVAENTEKPIILDDKGEEITNPNFKYSGAI